MPSNDAPAGPVPGVHQGREVCRGLLRQALADLGQPRAAGPGDKEPQVTAQEAWLVDRQFDPWPLDEALLLDRLSVWLRPGGRCLHIVGLDFDATSRALPRFARWRRDWSHRLEVLQPADGLLPAPLRGLITGAAVWQWLDAPDWRMRVITNPVQVRVAQEQVAAFLQRCEPAWPVTTLGL